MKAVLDQDVIKKYGDDLGPIPKGVGLERLRFDGKKLIDLADLSQIWVETKGSAYTLHATPVPGSTLVDMTYADRRRLVFSAGIPRLLTREEQTARTAAAAVSLAKNQTRARLKLSQGDTADQLADLYKLVFLLVEYLFDNDSDNLAALEQLLPHIRGIYDPQGTVDTLGAKIPALKAELTAYYQEKAEIITR